MPSIVTNTWDWLLQDPTGQQVGLGAVIVLLLVSILFGGRAAKRMAKHTRGWPVLAIITTAGFYGAVIWLKLPPEAWPAAAGAALMGFIILMLLFSIRRGKLAARLR